MLNKKELNLTDLFNLIHSSKNRYDSLLIHKDIEGENILKNEKKVLEEEKKNKEKILNKIGTNFSNNIDAVNCYNKQLFKIYKLEGKIKKKENDIEYLTSGFNADIKFYYNMLKKLLVEMNMIELDDYIILGIWSKFDLKEKVKALFKKINLQNEKGEPLFKNGEHINEYQSLKGEILALQISTFFVNESDTGFISLIYENLQKKIQKLKKSVVENDNVESIKKLCGKLYVDVVNLNILTTFDYKKLKGKKIKIFIPSDKKKMFDDLVNDEEKDNDEKERLEKEVKYLYDYDAYMGLLEHYNVNENDYYNYVDNENIIHFLNRFAKEKLKYKIENYENASDNGIKLPKMKNGEKFYYDLGGNNNRVFVYIIDELLRINYIAKNDKEQFLKKDDNYIETKKAEREKKHTSYYDFYNIDTDLGKIMKLIIKHIIEIVNKNFVVLDRVYNNRLYKLNGLYGVDEPLVLKTPKIDEEEEMIKEYFEILLFVRNNYYDNPDHKIKYINFCRSIIKGGDYGYMEKYLLNYSLFIHNSAENLINVEDYIRSIEGKNHGSVVEISGLITLLQKKVITIADEDEKAETTSDIRGYENMLKNYISDIDFLRVYTNTQFEKELNKLNNSFNLQNKTQQTLENNLNNNKRRIEKEQQKYKIKKQKYMEAYNAYVAEFKTKMDEFKAKQKSKKRTPEEIEYRKKLREL